MMITVIKVMRMWSFTLKVTYKFNAFSILTEHLPCTVAFNDEGHRLRLGIGRRIMV